MKACCLEIWREKLSRQSREAEGREILSADKFLETNFYKATVLELLKQKIVWRKKITI